MGLMAGYFGGLADLLCGRYVDAQLAFLKLDLKPYIRAFDREVRAVSFTLWNGLYQGGDAETLYALVRHLRPQRQPFHRDGPAPARVCT